MISERKGPTRSEQTNLLLALCQAVLEGTAAVEDLQQRLTEREEGLARAYAEFEAGARGEGEAWAVNRADVIQGVMDGFGAYGVALATLSQALASSDGPALEQGMQALTEATETFLTAMDAYDTRHLTDGPTPYPLLNMLLRMTDAARRGDIEPAAFGRLVGETHTYFCQALEELNDAPAEIPGEAVERLQRGLRQYLEGVTEMAAFVADHETRHLDAGLDQVRAAYAAMSEGFETYRRQSFEAGPTGSGLANTYIQAAEMVKAGRYDMALWEENLDRLDAHLAMICKNFEALSQVPTEMAVIQEEIPRVRHAFDLHHEANEAYRRFITSGEPSDLDQGTARLTEAMRLLDAARGVFDSAAEQEGRILCTRCFASNARDQRVCSACSAPLPRVEHLSPDSSTFQMAETGPMSAGRHEAVLTEHMQRLIEETNQVATGEITPTQYAATLHWMGQRLDVAEQQLADAAAINPDAFAAVDREQAARELALIEETRQLLLDGIVASRQGLAELHAWFDDGDLQHLKAGLGILFEGSQQVYQVSRISDMACKSALPPDPHAGLKVARLEDDDAEFDIETEG